jgi:hypothetical protein
MSIKVSWAPSTEPDIASYDLERSDSLATPAWALLVNVTHDLSGVNYDPATGKFFFLDVTGDTSKYYRLIAIDLAGNRSNPSTPFQAVASGPAIPNTVKVDHNYGAPAALRYQTSGGLPVEGALIRVFRKADYDVGLTSAALAVTQTDANGNWVNPIFLTTGFTYTLLYAKEGLYGPDKHEILV